MIKSSTILLIVLLVITALDTASVIRANYKYSKKFDSYWSLAEKASSIEKKIEGIDKFVDALAKSGFEGQYDAMYLETPDNSFDENFAALKSLQTRLHEIQNMDVKSFEYQTALQQITQQEQAEAKEMLSVFSGIWYKNNYLYLWGWIGLLNGIFVIIGFFIVFAWKSSEY